MADTGTWDASSLDLIGQQGVQHIWRVEFPGLTTANGYDVPAWDVSVRLDGGANPYGTAEFKVPASYIAETVDGTSTLFKLLVPKTLPPVRIWAGWRHPINGVMTDDLQILFTGFVTYRQFQVSADAAYVQFRAETGETAYDYTNNSTGSRNVINTWASLKDAFTYLLTNTPLLRSPNIVEESAWMNTPTAAQLASWRAGTYEPDDVIMDLARDWAAELGQWVRGNVRSANTVPELLVSADPYPYRSYFQLPATLFETITRTDDLDQWANVLKLTAQWWDVSSTSPKNTKRTYLGTDVAAGATTIALRSKNVTVNVKPTSGTLTATTPIALQWLRRVQDMSEVSYATTGQALWWLQPRIHGVQITGLGLNDAPGPIDTVSFNVDAGTMALTWATDNTRT